MTWLLSDLTENWWDLMKLSWNYRECPMISAMSFRQGWGVGFLPNGIYFCAQFVLFHKELFLANFCTWSGTIFVQYSPLFRITCNKFWTYLHILLKIIWDNLLKNLNCAILFAQGAKLHKIHTIKNKIAQKATFAQITYKCILCTRFNLTKFS